LRKSLRLLLVGEAVGLLEDFWPDIPFTWSWPGKELVKISD